MCINVHMDLFNTPNKFALNQNNIDSILFGLGNSDYFSKSPIRTNSQNISSFSQCLGF
jgi:hypothetical protein